MPLTGLGMLKGAVYEALGIHPGESTYFYVERIYMFNYCAQVLVFLITERYMNCGESTDSAGQKGGQSN